MLIHVDEWKNFKERVGLEEELKESEESEELKEELRLWASYRGQTLARTGTTGYLLTFCYGKCSC
jgi:callose synthase